MTPWKRLRRLVIGSCLGLGVVGGLLYGLAVSPCGASEPHEDRPSAVHRTPPPRLSINPLDPSVAPRSRQHQLDGMTTIERCQDLTLVQRPSC
jgi:hypothetical protein